MFSARCVKILQRHYQQYARETVGKRGEVIKYAKMAKLGKLS